MSGNNRMKLLALLMAVALGLSACARSAQNSTEGANIDLPEPTAAPARLVLGDSNSNSSREVTLYCATGSGLELNTVTRTVQISQGERPLRKVVEELLRANPAVGTLPMGATETRLEDVEFGGGVATVRLSLEASAGRSDSDYLLLCASVANTLLDIDGVDAVNVLTGDRSNPVCGLPSGALVKIDGNVAASYAQIQAESERFPADGGATISRQALLYFPTQGNQYLLPEARELTFSSEDYASALLQALQAGPARHSCSFSAIPGNLELLAAAPELSVSDAGERVLELRFSSVLPNYLALAGVEPWQLYGSVVLTLCSFLPELDAVRISFEEVYVTECAMPDGRRAQFEDGLMRRADFSACSGSAAMLYFAREDGTLARVECPVSQLAAHSAASILEAMISMGDSDQASLKSIFPEGIGPADILGVAVEGRVATVNLSGNFYARCQSLDADGERALVYGMINALAELDEIGAVSFLVEGEQVDALVKDIYLRTALMPDPGLIADSRPESETEAAG